MIRTTSLAATLRTWRDRLDPVEAGLAKGTSRRASGLRREELAELAGISVDYVVRLEQGRATAPSGDVVASLARSLRLDRAERDHLYGLAGLQPPADETIGERISPGVLRLLGRLGDVAVAVFTADWRMLWWNASWAAVVGDPSDIPPEERSPVVARFPVAATSRSIMEWPVRSQNGAASDAAFVADMRRATARYPEDRRLASFIERTLRGNARFAELWRRGAVGEHAGDRKTIEHPAEGDIALDCDVLHASDADLRIVALTAEPGSEDALRLERARAAYSVPPRP